MRLISRFAKEKKDCFEIIDVFDNDIKKHSINKQNPKIDTITIKYPSAIWMERKIRDEFGIEFKGSFDNRYLVKHERFPKDIYPLRKDFQLKDIEFSNYEAYKYEEVEGEGIFTLPVGPIHGGIIEPGHFQFSLAGEEILHIEIRHFYKYRGIEKMCEGKKPLEIKKIISRISGSESIAYQIAYFDILAQSCKMEIPESFKRKEAILLEIERLIHHISDLGAIPNEGGFAASLAYMSKLSEEIRRILFQITGHRFGFDCIKEDIKINNDVLKEFLSYLKKEMEFFEQWITDIPSVWDRLDTTGELSKQKAIKYGVVGVGARASGVPLDVRDNDFYKKYGYQMQLSSKGDISARFKVRIKEVFNSIEMINNLMTEEKDDFKLGDFKDGEYMSFVESSIGELFMYMDIKHGVIDRFYVRDPSHINWQAFHTTVYKDIVADFPLINKSFDLSYAGNDL